MSSRRREHEPRSLLWAYDKAHDRGGDVQGGQRRQLSKRTTKPGVGESTQRLPQHMMLHPVEQDAKRIIRHDNNGARINNSNGWVAAG